MSQEVPPTSSSAPLRARHSFGERLLGALKLDAAIYDELEHDETALGQAAGVVALGALAQGLAAVQAGLGAALGGVVTGLLGWVFATAIVWAIGVKAMKHTSNFPELLRTLGFASAPKLILFAGILPLGPLAGLLWLAVGILTLLAFVVAVRQALDVSTGRAVWVCVLAVAVSMVVGMIFGGPS